MRAMEATVQFQYYNITLVHLPLSALKLSIIQNTAMSPDIY